MRSIFFSALIILGVFFGFFPFAQGEDELDGETVLMRRDELKAQMSKIQDEINQYRTELKGKEKEEKSLSGEIAIFARKIRKAELELSQTALALRSTGFSIEANSKKMETISARIEHEKEVIAELIRATSEEDSKSFIELIMSTGDISDFVEHEKLLESIQLSIYTALERLKQAKSNLEEEQRKLEEEKEEQTKLKSLQKIQEIALKDKKTEKNRLLNFTRGEKVEFERLLAQKEKDVEQIKNQIFLLEGVGISLPLHKAYEIAKFASSKVGVRPAFLLAVLKQESSWGKNVGQCFLVDFGTGMGKGKNTGSPYPRTMKATRDVEPFLQITKELGRDPYNTLVSCPHQDYGYGGAMGPAQFLPSTWMSYREELISLLGHVPDPWDIHDSFTASALKLARGGASAQTLDAEWKAAMIYYAGSRWNNPVYSFYGDSVMELAAAIQSEIEATGS